MRPVSKSCLSQEQEHRKSILVVRSEQGTKALLFGAEEDLKRFKGGRTLAILTYRPRRVRNCREWHLAADIGQYQNLGAMYVSLKPEFAFESLQTR